MKKLLLFAFTAAAVAAITIFSSCEKNPPEDPATYAISVSPNNLEWGSVTAKIDGKEVAQAEMGKTVALEATPKTGCKFTGWQVAENAVVLGNKASTGFTMPEKAVQIIAVFAADNPDAQKFAITKTAVEHATVTVKVGGAEATEAAAGAIVDLEIAPETGYQLAEWALTATGTGDDLSNLLANKTALKTSFTMPAQAVTVAATVVPAAPGTFSVTISGIANGSVTITTLKPDGTTTDKSSTMGLLDGITAGTAVKIVAQPASGYNFTGWTEATGYTPPNASGKILEFAMPASNVAMKANFALKPTRILTLAAIANGSISASVGSTDLFSGSAVEVGATVTITANPLDGNNFNGWNVRTSSGGAVDVADKNASTTTFTMPDSNVEVDAVIVSGTTYTLTFAAPEDGGTLSVSFGGNSYTTSPVQVPGNMPVTITAVVPATHSFVRWQATGNITVAFDNISSASTTFKMPTAAVDLTYSMTAQIANPRTVMLRPVYNGEVVMKANGVVIENHATVAVGATISLSATPTGGSTFKEWKVYTETGTPIITSSAALTISFVMPDDNVEISATFIAPAARIFFTPPAEGGTLYVRYEGTSYNSFPLEIPAGKWVSLISYGIPDTHTFGEWKSTCSLPAPFDEPTMTATEFKMPAADVTITYTLVEK